MWVMRKYLDQNRISRDLVIRANRYITNILETKRKFVQQQDVEFLGLLSGPLLNDLLFELYSAHVLVHPFFRELRERQAAILRKLCSFAVNRTYLSCGDELFGPGSICTQMYFVVGGQLTYIFQRLNSIAVKELRHGAWFSEAVLWTPWHHRGKMRAKFDSQLVTLIASKFREVLTQEYQDIAVTKIYGGAFVKALNDILKRDNGYSVSDLQDDILETDGVKTALAGELEESLDSTPKSVMEANFENQVFRKSVQLSNVLPTTSELADDNIAHSTSHPSSDNGGASQGAFASNSARCICLL